MPFCDYCGDEIEFRYMDGRPTPIHVNGGWCSGYSGKSSESSSAPFRSIASYVNPNAHCPVCGEKVWFYQSPYGGRVFFDNLGWPWPKHRCTDNPQAQKSTVKLIAATYNKPFCTSRGESLDVCRLTELREETDSLFLKFSRVEEHVAFKTSVPIKLLKDRDITVKDLQSAPSFVVRTYETCRLVEFISGRKGKIDSFEVPRIRPPAICGTAAL